MEKFVISNSPHIQTPITTRRLMLDVILALSPAALFSVYLFGLGAVIIIITSILSAVFFEWLLTKYLLKRSNTISDLSAIVTGLLLAMNVPSNLPIWMLLVGTFVAIGIAKISFGGLGQNIFNPAIMARVFMLISFPVAMTSWPLPLEDRMKYIDVHTGATPLGIIKEGVKNGESVSKLLDQIPSHSQLFYGIMGGSLGEMAALLLLLGGIYLLIKKVITWHIPVSILGSVLVFTGILWIINPDKYADPMFHLLTGGLMLGSIFMATDYVTSPMTPKGQIIYGILIGLLTVIIRVWGAYPEGVSFAILIMNAFVPLINRYTRPKVFGTKPQKQEKNG